MFINGVDLFAGAGGLTLGLKLAGVQIVVAVENSPSAAATYEKNNPEITLIKADGEVIGYEMGDRNFAIKNAIEISPPEVLVQLENTNVMRGLSYIGISIPLLTAGINCLVEALKIRFLNFHPLSHKSR